MKNTIKQLTEILDRTANNCLFYEREEDIPHLMNEAGCLRGAMYMAEVIGVPIPAVYYTIVTDAYSILQTIHCAPCNECEECEECEEHEG